MGALGEGGVRVLNDRRHAGRGVTDAELSLGRGARARRGRRDGRGVSAATDPMIELAGRTVLIVDDGLATGGTARAAIQVARAHGAAQGRARRPGGAARRPCTLCERGRRRRGDAADPDRSRRSGVLYADFTQTSDDEVITLLAAHDRVARVRASDPSADDEVEIAADGSSSADTSPIPGRSDRRSSCSPTGAGAVATAPATAPSPESSTAPASARCCSTCSPTGGTERIERVRHRPARPQRLAIATAWLDERARPARDSRSGTSVRAPAPRRRCGRRPSRTPTSRPSSPGAAGPTSPWHGSARCVHRPC